MTILGIDLGTACGWAVLEDGQISSAGTFITATKREITEWGKRRMDRRRDPRVTRLRDFLARLHAENQPTEVVVFEDVEFQSYRKQTQLWSALRAALWLAIPGAVKMDCVNVKTLKKVASGNPDATKAEMMYALARRMPNQIRLIERNTKLLALLTTNGSVLDDNAVDACHVALWAHKIYQSNKQ